jgi:uncharacterized HAD superfamily protein
MWNKIILADVDGVLLNWIDPFEERMRQLGYKKAIDGEYEIHASYGIHSDEANQSMNDFNESVLAGSLPPLLDSIKYIKKLHEEHGYVLHCVSAFPAKSKSLRLKNLKRLFGKTVIGRLECTETSENKYHVLKEYQDSGIPWIEDHLANSMMGYELGLDCYLMNQDYNKQHQNIDDVKRINNWKEFYELLL